MTPAQGTVDAALDPTSPDPTSLDPETEAHPLVQAALRLAPRLAAGAAETDASGVARERLALLAEAGLHGLEGPAELGGAGAPDPVKRRVAEVLAGADPQVWFVWFQHHPVVKMLSGSENRALAEREVPRLSRGETFAGVAFSHLRSARPSVRATRVDGGWRVTGVQPWCTGWGLIDVALLGAVTDEGDVLFALTPAREGDGLHAGDELAMAAMGATHTVSVHLEDHPVPDDAVVLRLPFASWTAADRQRNANVQPATFGVALAALDLLAESAPDVAFALRRRVLAVRAEAYRLLDEVAPDEALDERRARRAGAMLLCMEAVTALVAGLGGRSLAPGHRGQQLLRAAAFQLVHSQDQPIREQTLEQLVGGRRRHQDLDLVLPRE